MYIRMYVCMCICSTRRECVSSGSVQQCTSCYATAHAHSLLQLLPLPWPLPSPPPPPPPVQESGSYAGELSSLVAPNLSDLSQKKKAQIKRLFTSKDQLSARLDKVEDQAHKVGGRGGQRWAGWADEGVVVCKWGDFEVCCQSLFQ